MVKQNNPSIEHTTIERDNDVVISFQAVKEVKKLGNTGHVTIPSNLIGKFVKIEYFNDRDSVAIQAAPKEKRK